MTPERRHWFRSGVLIVNFERISKFFLMFFIHASISIEISSQCNIGNFSLERVIFVPFPSRDFFQIGVATPTLLTGDSNTDVFW